MVVLVAEMCKIPYVRKEVLKALKIQDEVGDPPTILNTMYHGNNGEENPPFYLSLGINGLHLNNCMLDSRASANVISFKFMKQLGLQTTHPYVKVCGIDSKRVKCYNHIKDLKVYLHVFPHIDISMNVVMIDVQDAWGILLSRSWFAIIVGFLSMDLTHAHILWEMGHLIFYIVNRLPRIM